MLVMTDEKLSPEREALQFKIGQQEQSARQSQARIEAHVRQEAEEMRKNVSLIAQEVKKERGEDIPDKILINEMADPEKPEQPVQRGTDVFYGLYYDFSTNILDLLEARKSKDPGRKLPEITKRPVTDTEWIRFGAVVIRELRDRLTRRIVPPPDLP